jgi:hypothetical protein
VTLVGGSILGGPQRGGQPILGVGGGGLTGRRLPAVARFGQRETAMVGQTGGCWRRLMGLLMVSSIWLKDEAYSGQLRWHTRGCSSGLRHSNARSRQHSAGRAVERGGSSRARWEMRGAARRRTRTWL